jgi:hypothetical protein
MSTTGPGKPSSRRVAAALPPAMPPPTITIGFPLVRFATQYILPPVIYLTLPELLHAGERVLPVLAGQPRKASSLAVNQARSSSHG